VVDSGRLRTEAVRRAAEILGGSRPLRAYLNASALVVGLWISGVATPPPDVFLKVVDLITEKGIDSLREKSVDSLRKS
jgi:hypothetical protein